MIRNYGITVCPKSSDPLYMVSYYIKWATTFWTYSMVSAISLFSTPNEYKRKFQSQVALKSILTGIDFLN